MDDQGPPVWIPAHRAGATYGWGVKVPSIYGDAVILRWLTSPEADKIAALVNDAYETGREHGEEIMRRVYQ